MGLCKGGSMNFSEIAKDMGEKTLQAVNYIVGLKISDSDKKRLLTNLFKSVGYPFYDKIFADTSELFASDAIGTLGYENPEYQVERLSNKVVQNYNLSRISTPAILQGFYDSILADAEHESFSNAITLEKHPTLTRLLQGETCRWCIDRTGTFVDPDGELFARHDNCDCLFITKGYNSRNGILTNYRKAKS